MAAMTLDVGAVLNDDAAIGHRIQRRSHGAGWFAVVKLADGQYGPEVSLIVNDPAVLDALAAAVAAARDELIAAEKADRDAAA